MSARAGVDKLRGDADLISDLPEAAFDNVLRIELASKFLNINSLLLVGKVVLRANTRSGSK